MSNLKKTLVKLQVHLKLKQSITGTIANALTDLLHIHTTYEENKECRQFILKKRPIKMVNNYHRFSIKEYEFEMELLNQWIKDEKSKQSNSSDADIYTCNSMV